MRPSKLKAIREKNPTTARPKRADDKPATLLKNMQTQMDVDLKALKQLLDIKDKAKTKAKMLLNYLPFVDTYIEKNHCYPNSVLVQVMIWLFDIFDIDRGLRLALHLIKQGCHTMPTNFSRSMMDFVVDAMYDWAKLQLDNKQSASPYLDDLITVMERDDWELHPLMRSKIYAIAAKHKLEQDDYQAVLTLADKAEAANPGKSGTKTLRKTAQNKLKKLSDQAFNSPDESKAAEDTKKSVETDPEQTSQ